MKNIIITGGNSGLGFETAKKIAAKGDYKIILACRNMEKADKAKNKIIDETKNPNIEAMQVDTSSLSSVSSFAKNYIDIGEKIYALVNNAGVSSMENSGMTYEGFNLVMATNYLGHFMLTQKLLPFVEDDGRIYNVSSDMHNPPRGELTWPGGEAVLYLDGRDRRSYSYSKLCLIYMAHELDKKLKEEGKGISVNAFNPGYMGDTNFMKGGKLWSPMVKHAMPDRYGDLAASSDALARLVTEDEFAKISGEYFDRSVNTAKSSELSYVDDNARDLWDASIRCIEGK